MRKTKIVCTIGPSVETEDMMRELILAGMNVARINFSHGGGAEQESKINLVKKVRDELDIPVALLLDTKGPEIRIGVFNEKVITLEPEDIFTLVNEDIVGDKTKVSVSYKELYREVTAGQRILINDGTIEVEVIEVVERDIRCRVLNGGMLSNKKSINVPDLPLNLPSLTEKDIEDLKYAVMADFEFVAASFVRRAQDIIDVKRTLEENGGHKIKVIAKIENREGIENFDEILKVSDGIMVARGDLGVEVPLEEVPIYQKVFIKKTYRAGKSVITATQMLESMIKNPRPTRAEVSDVANAIFDGSGAIMLSGETAVGDYPIECVKVMNRIATTTEGTIKYWKRFKRREYDVEDLDHEFKIDHSICATAMNVDAKAIFTYTQVGNTPRIVCSFGPAVPVFAITEDIKTYRQLSLYWNVYPVLIEHKDTVNEMIQEGICKVKEAGLINEGDTVAISGGSPIMGDAHNKDCELSLNRTIGGVITV